MKDNAYIIPKELQDDITSALKNKDIEIYGIGESSKKNPNFTIEDYEIKVRVGRSYAKESVKTHTESGITILEKMKNFQVADAKVEKSNIKKNALRENIKEKALDPKNKKKHKVSQKQG